MSAVAPASQLCNQTNGVDHDQPLRYGPCLPKLAVQAPLASDAILFYKRAFGAVEVSKTLHSKRKAEHEQPLVVHAHLKFGGAEITLCDESELMGPNVKSPASLKGTSCILHVITEDVDAAYGRAVEAGATAAQEVAEQPWGGRYGKVVDPYGFVWVLASPHKDMHAVVADTEIDGQDQ